MGHRRHNVFHMDAQYIWTILILAKITDITNILFIISVIIVHLIVHALFFGILCYIFLQSWLCIPSF